MNVGRYIITKWPRLNDASSLPRCRRTFIWQKDEESSKRTKFHVWRNFLSFVIETNIDRFFKYTTFYSLRTMWFARIMRKVIEFWATCFSLKRVLFLENHDSILWNIKDNETCSDIRLKMFVLLRIYNLP